VAGFNGSRGQLNHWTSLHCGVDVHNTASSEHDIRKCIAIACYCMASLDRNIWHSSISLPTKLQLYRVFILPVIMVALCNRADHIYFHPVVSSSFFLSFFLSSPNLSDWRLDVCHTSTHGVMNIDVNTLQPSSSISQFQSSGCSTHPNKLRRS